MKPLEDQRCVILGAGGFIGTNLARHLTDRAGSVLGFGRSPRRRDALDGVAWMTGDFSDGTALTEATRGADTVFHLVNASTPQSANDDMVGDLLSNVVATLRLLEVCAGNGVGRVVFISSGGTVYGPDAPIPTREETGVHPLTAYGVSKLAIEHYLHIHERLRGLDYRILRVANPYGPFQLATRNQGVIGAFIRDALAGRPLTIWGDGSVVRDYLHVEDVCEAFAAAATHRGPDRLFNIGSGVGRSLNEIVADLAAQLAHPVEVERREGRAVDIPVSVLDCARAKTALGWTARTDFQDGLARTIAWFRSIRGE